ncbi:MAG: hypothetical protein V1494_04380 [Candidatus Diapherotrites archaeon]
MAEKKFDLAKEHELALAVMNLAAAEEHLAFTAGKTGKPELVDFYNEIRALRSKYMDKIVKNKDGENWCVSKHLLVSAMHLIETAVKHGAAGEKKQATEMFADAVDVFRSFWLLQEFGEKNEHNGKPRRKIP